MANQEHLGILKQGVEVWNKWREENPMIKPNLSDAKLTRSKLPKVNFRNANLRNISLDESILSEADFTEARLVDANLIDSDLSWAKLSATLEGAKLVGATLQFADLTEADLQWALLTHADMRNADLRGADLRQANLSDVNLSYADLSGSYIYAISAWNITLQETKQSDLIITNGFPYIEDEPIITVDNLEVAQFIYLLLNNSKIRDVINTITSKVVLILGRFTKERKPVLDALRNELRNYDCLPVVFDFEKPSSRNFTETVSTLAHLSRFVIADLTDAKSIPQELERIVPHLPSVLIQPIIHINETEYAMFEDYKGRVLPIYRYQDIPSLLASIKEHIITPVELKEYEKEKNKALEEEIRKLKEENKKLRKGR